jgi:hypothetical protein
VLAVHTARIRGEVADCRKALDGAGLKQDDGGKDFPDAWNTGKN